MPLSNLAKILDAWTAEAVMASGYLTRLYRALGDAKQANLALMGRGASEERVARLGLHGRVMELQKEFARIPRDETEAEAAAWRSLVMANAGLLALHGLVDREPGSGSPLRGASTAAQKSFRKTLQGLRIAFPADMAERVIQAALDGAAEGCVDALAGDMGKMADPDTDNVRHELRAAVLESLVREAAAGSGRGG